MVKKLVMSVGLIGVFLLGACGPKGASQATLDQLEEARAALEAAQTKLSECQSEKENLANQKTENETKLQNLQAERDSLSNLLELIKQGY